MAVTYKGLTIKFGGDTTELQSALKRVQSTAKDTQGALKDINSALKLDPGNTDLLTEKAKLLNRAYDETKTKLDAYKSALSSLEDKQRSGAQLTEREKAQYSSLKAQVAICESQLESYADDLKSVSREAEASKSKLYQFGQTIEDNSGKLSTVGKGLETAGTAITGTVVGATTALVGLATSQEESIEQTHQLNAAWQDAGGTTEQASAAYTMFYKLLGESDTATEAAQNLARMTTNEQELDQWTNIAAGSFAKFGDALPLENLVEASKETASTGTVTGGLADALNWATASNEQWSEALSGNQAAQQAFNEQIAAGATKEDAFNAALAACGSEQERSTLITQTLDGLYGQIGQTYQETNSTMLDTREAQAELNQKLEEAGEAAMPLKTKVLELGTALLEKVTPALEGMSNWYSQLSPEQQDLVTNIGLGTLAFGGLATGIGKVLQKGAEFGSTIKSISTGFEGIKTVLGTVGSGWTSFTGLIATNPILLGVAAVAAAVAGLTWFFTQTETGKQMWSDFTAWISEKWQAVQDFFSGVPAFWQCVWDSVTSKVEEVKTNLGTAWDTISGAASTAFGGIRDTISNDMQTGQTVASSSASALQAALSGDWSTAQAEAGNAFTAIKDNIDGKMTAAREVAVSIGDAIGEKLGFPGLGGTVASVFGGIRDTISNDMQTGQTVASSSASALQAALSGDWSTAQAEAGNAFTAIKDNIDGKMTAAREVAVSIGDAIGEKLGFPGLGGTVASVFDGIKSTITGAIQGAWDTISGIPSRIANAFSSIHISFPHINLPHFTVSWNDIGGVVKLPSIGVSWYAKGGWFDRASIIGVGEGGEPEHVAPDSKLREAVESAVSKAMEQFSSASAGIAVAVTVNATVANGLDAYETGKQLGDGIASRLKQRGVTVAS